MKQFGTVLADPPWRFTNRTGKVAPEHGRLHRYKTMPLDQICSLGPQVLDLSDPKSHLYVWVPGALLPWGLRVVAAWGFDYSQVITWRKVTKDGNPDLSCMGFRYRVVNEFMLLGVRGECPSKLHNVPNEITAQKRGHSIKPDQQYPMIESMSPGPYLELFARKNRSGWSSWGDQLGNSPILITTDPDIVPTWRETVREAIGANGPVQLSIVYERSKMTPKVRAAIEAGHRWKSQIRRTLQIHFNPEGRGVWGVA